MGLEFITIQMEIIIMEIGKRTKRQETESCSIIMETIIMANGYKIENKGKGNI